MDILSAISHLPFDIQEIIYKKHRLNEIEEMQRRVFSKMVKHLDFYADSARYTAPFSEYYFADLDVMSETDEVFEEMMNEPRSQAIDERSFCAYYGVDGFDSVACRQHELKGHVLGEIGKLRLIEWYTGFIFAFIFLSKTIWL